MFQPLRFAKQPLVAASIVVCAVLIGCAPVTSPTSAPAPTSKTAAPTSAAAQGAAKPDADKMRAYFEGKTIELYIGYAAGGGYDIRGRIFAEFFPKYVPGSPKVAVVNLPGGGGLQATREVMRARPDGLKMVIVPAGIYINELLGDDQEGFEVTQPLKLGNYEVVADDYTTLQVRSEVATTWQQIAEAGQQGKKFKYGAPAVGNSQALAGEWLAAVGAPVEVVYGYGGTNEVLAALDRKEIDMYATDGPAATKQASFIRIQQGFPEWLTQESKYVTPVLSTRVKAPDAWFDHFGFKAPPHVLEAVEANQLQKQAYDLAFKVREGVDPLALAPKTPDDIYQTLRQGMQQAAEDPGFKEAMEQRGFVGGYRSPEELDEGLTALGQAPKEVVDVVRRMYTGK